MVQAQIVETALRRSTGNGLPVLTRQATRTLIRRIFNMTLNNLLAVTSAPLYFHTGEYLNADMRKKYGKMHIARLEPFKDGLEVFLY